MTSGVQKRGAIGAMVKTKRVLPTSPSLDPLHVYLQSLKATPLLSAEEEHALGVLKERGQQARALLDQHTHMVPRVRTILLQRQRDGDAAFDRLYLSNLRLVVSVARCYLDDHNPNAQMLDLIQEGNLALHRAVLRFDPSKGTRFSTYATYWLKQGMVRFKNRHRRAWYVPTHISEIHQTYQRVSGDLFSALQRPPTLREVSSAMNVPVETLQLVADTLEPCESLDQPRWDDDGQTSIGASLADPARNADPAYAVVLRELRAELAALLTQTPLEPLERAVLSLRYGLNASGSSFPHATIAKRLNIGVGAVYAHEERGLTKLRLLPEAQRRMESYRD